jgi:hypothetical protein
MERPSVSGSVAHPPEQIALDSARNESSSFDDNQEMTHNMIWYESYREAVMNQLSVRGLDKELERRLREVARERNTSLNKAAILLLRKGAGLDEADRHKNMVGDSLDHLIGRWTAEEEKEFLQSIEAFEQIDEMSWS